jgi:TRAP-type C4-dicarboxylate transport system permease small subunit
MLVKSIERLSILLRRLAGLMLVGMMLLTCSDVAGNFFGSPILGSEEVVGLMASLLIAFALPAAHEEKAHIGIDLLYLKFPNWLKRINNAFIHSISAVFFAVTGWECYKYGNDLKRVGEVSPTLELPTYYITYAISAACFILTLVILLEIYRIVIEGHYE